MYAESESPAPVMSPPPAAAGAPAPAAPVMYASSQALVTFLTLLPQLRGKNMYKLRTYAESFRGTSWPSRRPIPPRGADVADSLFPTTAKDLVSVLVRHRISLTREDGALSLRALCAHSPAANSLPCRSCERGGVCGAPAVVVAQKLVDDHLMWHADRDQPFKDNSAPFRFVTPRVWRARLAAARLHLATGSRAHMS